MNARFVGVLELQDRIWTVQRPINVTLWYSRLHEKSEQGFCLSRCTWTTQFAKRDAAFGNGAFGACSLQIFDVRSRVWWLHSLPSTQIRLMEPCVAGVRQKSYVQTRWVSMDPQRQPTSFAVNLTLQDMADNKTDGWVDRTKDDYHSRKKYYISNSWEGPDCNCNAILILRREHACNCNWKNNSPEGPRL